MLGAGVGTEGAGWVRLLLLLRCSTPPLSLLLPESLRLLLAHHCLHSR